MTMSSETVPRVLSLAEVAERLNMKRPNVAKFLVRRGVEPAFAKAQGYFWWEADIERVKADREADAGRLASDERRRAAALRNHGDGATPGNSKGATHPAAARLGARQRMLLLVMCERPVRSDTDVVRLALRRLRERGLVEPLTDRGMYGLTPEGREVVSGL